jgi:inorganic pyrophosphatase/exopolyphosphatase
LAGCSSTVNQNITIEQRKAYINDKSAFAGAFVVYILIITASLSSPVTDTQQYRYHHFNNDTQD